MAENNTIARPYAQAVFETARDDRDLDAWSESLELASALLADGQVVAYLGDPAFNDTQRLEFLTGLFAKAGSRKLDGGDRKGLNFLRLLLENDRVAVLPEIAQRFEVLKSRIENVVEVVVTSASPLDDGQRAAYAAALKKRLGSEIQLTTEIDENLIGGAVIRAGDVVIDGSLRARLNGLATALTQ